MEAKHSLTLNLWVCSLTLASPSGWVVFGVVSVVCLTAVALKAISAGNQNNEEKKTEEEEEKEKEKEKERKKERISGECVKPREQQRRVLNSFS